MAQSRRMLDRLRHIYRRLVPLWIRLGYSGDLNRLALACGCDKWGYHWYTQHYQRHFGPRRWQRLKILEIGVGGYDDPLAGGNSLRMWRSYFPRSTIYGIDIFDKSALQEPRIRIFRGSQTDGPFLQSLLREAGPFDIIIDDGSHRNQDVLFSFEFLFPSLRSGGFYAIEDTLTSYASDLADHDSGRTIPYFKNLIDGMNYAERPGYEPGYFDLNVVAMHFYHNLIILEKGPNREGGCRDSLDGSY